jgi:indolepyruvate ferredoxin oxidoreductase
MPNPSENWLLRAKADLTPAIIAKAIAKRLKKLGVPEDVAARMDQRLDEIAARERGMAALTLDTGERVPWFCSGCPHNTSTRVPEGSRAVAGIGCHYMAVWMDRSTSTFTQMGGEGVPWVGQAPFTKESTSSPTSATAPTSTAAAWRSARASPPASTSPTSCSTTTPWR